MEYTKLIKAISQQSDTRFPALLSIIIKECIKRKIFKEGGMKIFIQRVIQKESIEKE